MCAATPTGQVAAQATSAHANAPAPGDVVFDRADLVSWAVLVAGALVGWRSTAKELAISAHTCTDVVARVAAAVCICLARGLDALSYRLAALTNLACTTVRVVDAASDAFAVRAHGVLVHCVAVGVGRRTIGVGAALGPAIRRAGRLALVRPRNEVPACDSSLAMECAIGTLCQATVSEAGRSNRLIAVAGERSSARLSASPCAGAALPCLSTLCRLAG